MKQAFNNHLFYHLYRMYRRMVKRSILLLALISMSAHAISQASLFEGKWKGELVIPNDSRTAALEMEIIDGIVINHLPKKSQRLKKVSTHSKVTPHDFVYEWKNTLLIAEETEVLTATPVTNDSLVISWLRTCTVDTQHKGRKNETWTITGSGYMKRIPPAAIAADHSARLDFIVHENKKPQQ